MHLINNQFNYPLSGHRSGGDPGGRVGVGRREEEAGGGGGAVRGQEGTEDAAEVLPRVEEVC